MREESRPTKANAISNGQDGRRILSIGIDPGLKGAVVAIDSFKLQPVYVGDTPVYKVKQRAIYNIADMVKVLRNIVNTYGNTVDHVHVTLEQAQAMPGQGVTSMFMTGYGFGLWHGIVVSLGLSVDLVRPMVWQKVAFVGLGNTKKAEPKVKSILRAQQLFPTLELIPDGCRVERDGRSDAALMAYYGIKTFAS